MLSLKRIGKQGFRRLGYEIRRTNHQPPLELSAAFAPIYARAAPFTMTPVERMSALHDAVKYLEENQIAGDFVECGVWRGGSAMNMALSLKHLASTERHIHLFDTFTGMSTPTSDDFDLHGKPAAPVHRKMQKNGVNEWCYASLEDVQQNMASTGYPESYVHLVQGKVEDTLPAHAPEKIALLRLDTDWYESTAHELEHLFPRLAPKGILIIDDYGHWRGARRAADEYFEKHSLKPLLFAVDYTCRMLVKS